MDYDKNQLVGDAFQNAVDAVRKIKGQDRKPIAIDKNLAEKMVDAAIEQQVMWVMKEVRADLEKNRTMLVEHVIVRMTGKDVTLPIKHSSYDRR